jgi:hypothetical protein
MDARREAERPNVWRLVRIRGQGSCHLSVHNDRKPPPRGGYQGRKIGFAATFPGHLKPPCQDGIRSI